jgi:hypothetical protein
MPAASGRALDVRRSTTVQFSADSQSQSICGNSWSVYLMKRKTSGDDPVGVFQISVPSGSLAYLDFPSSLVQVNDYVRVRVKADGKTDPACVGFSGYLLLAAKG